MKSTKNGRTYLVQYRWPTTAQFTLLRGYSPHELFYSFRPSFPLDAQVDAPSENPVNNADAYALPAEERLPDGFTFMRKVTGRQMGRMKRYYDASVKPARFDEGSFVL